MKKEKTERRNKSTRKRLMTVIIPAAAALLIIGVILGLYFLDENGVFLRAKKLSKGEGIEVNGAMMSYFFWSTFYDSLEKNGGYYAGYGLQSPEDIDNENPIGGTWRETFRNATTEAVDVYMTYAVYAEENGVSVSESGKKAVDDKLKEIKNAAILYAKSDDEYTAFRYGKGVKLSDVEDALGLVELANAGYSAAYDSISVGESELSDYRSKHSKEILLADYCFLSIGESGKNTLTDSQKQFYSQEAEKLTKASSLDDFKEKVAECLENINDTYPLDSEKRLGGAGLASYKEEVLSSLLREGSEYDPDVSFDEWIFSDERKEGDTYVNHREPYGTYGIVYIVRPAYLDPEWEKKAKDEITDGMIEKIYTETNLKYPRSSKELIGCVADL